MWLFFAFGGLCRLRKHGSNCPRLAGELKYFCNASVIYEFAGHRGCDTARVNDYGLSYFDDYALGSTYECGSVSIDQASIVAFAKEFDPQPFHVDPMAAAASLGSAGLDELRWPHPVRPGDTLRVRATVVESRRSLSKPDRGIVKTVVEATNSGGATVMRATAINFMLVRPDSAA